MMKSLQAKCIKSVENFPQINAGRFMMYMATREAWLDLLLTWALSWEIASKNIRKVVTRCHIWSWLGGRVEEYSAADMDDIREDWSIYAVTSIVTIF
ncbi:hypothetical protein HanRHA438_Chr09g0394031 [Helianthus annuus]|nr:hypothetical protein HanRHA438_Chr09g0394031 [Helianthus annuus]